MFELKFGKLGAINFENVQSAAKINLRTNETKKGYLIQSIYEKYDVDHNGVLDENEISQIKNSLFEYAKDGNLGNYEANKYLKNELGLKNTNINRDDLYSAMLDITKKGDQSSDVEENPVQEEPVQEEVGQAKPKQDKQEVVQEEKTSENVKTTDEPDKPENIPANDDAVADNHKESKVVDNKKSQRVYSQKSSASSKKEAPAVVLEDGVMTIQKGESPQNTTIKTPFYDGEGNFLGYDFTTYDAQGRGTLTRTFNKDNVETGTIKSKYYDNKNGTYTISEQKYNDGSVVQRVDAYDKNYNNIVSFYQDKATGETFLTEYNLDGTVKFEGYVSKDNCKLSDSSLTVKNGSVETVYNFDGTKVEYKYNDDNRIVQVTKTDADGKSTDEKQTKITLKGKYSDDSYNEALKQFCTPGFAGPNCAAVLSPQAECMSAIRNARAAVTALEENKFNLMRDLNISGEEYNHLASMVLGLAEQESHFGALIDNNDNGAELQLRAMEKRVAGMVGMTQSEGITQLRYNTTIAKDPKVKELCAKYGIESEDDFKNDPAKAAVASMIVLHQKQKDITGSQKWQARLDKNNSKIQEPDKRLTTDDLVVKYWNGIPKKMRDKMESDNPKEVVTIDYGVHMKNIREYRKLFEIKDVN